VLNATTVFCYCTDTLDARQHQIQGMGLPCMLVPLPPNGACWPLAAGGSLIRNIGCLSLPGMCATLHHPCSAIRPHQFKRQPVTKEYGPNPGTAGTKSHHRGLYALIPCALSPQELLYDQSKHYQCPTVNSTLKEKATAVLLFRLCRWRSHMWSPFSLFVVCILLPQPRWC